MTKNPKKKSKTVSFEFPEGCAGVVFAPDGEVSIVMPNHKGNPDLPESGPEISAFCGAWINAPENDDLKKQLLERAELVKAQLKPETERVH